ncbi:mRNA-capping enzyme [Bradysia coprophila]|uniref:mRNA-capping enzyme n=1 Tax=Bradysia coprophila TaxID=38358 RepID=UPI00187DCAC0|nr:mRNA-capping enzyme [Bradysia coprophila]
MSRHPGPGPIPDRWLYCPRNANSFVAEKFLAFKTPLSDRFTSQMPMECQFLPEMVFSYAKMFKAKIGLWIDLTNTKRFYDRREVEEHGSQYMKLQCRGHGEAPSHDQTQSFIELVDQFITDNPLDMVGVHCTHGFNRTGFLIVSYMVERMDCSVEAAVLAFAQARPPGIYKEDYIKELFRRYDDVEDALSAPEKPTWCNKDDSYEPDNHATVSRKRKAESTTSKQEDNGDELEDDDQTEENGEPSGSTNEPTQKKKKRKEFLNLNATFMAGVPGVTLLTEQPRLGQLQSTVQTMCAWGSSGFPGSQPVSMDQKNINLLHMEPYRVSWKADGTRYMMLVLEENEVYFFDRDNSCFQVEGLRFPHHSDFKRHLTNTLLDGEMVIDKVNGLSIPRYLVYDVVKYEGRDIGQEPFYPNRLDCIQKQITDPRNNAMRHGWIIKDREPFSVRPKCFWDVTQAGALLAPKFANSLAHEPDGLIFQPSLDPYKSGACSKVLKWKPLHMNSVDFKLKITQQGGMGMLTEKMGYLYVGQHEQPFASIKYTKYLKELDGKIIECKFENNSWVFMRERTDKSFPNSYNTAMAVCKSIQYPVTTEYLLHFIKKRRFGGGDDGEIMPPPRPRTSR